MEPSRFAVALPVGPGSREVERTADLLDSLRSFEPGPWTVVMVDDGRESRELAARFAAPAGCTLVSLPHPRRELGARHRRIEGLCPAILAGFAWVARHASEARFVIKLDTDALVIGPFSERMERFLHGYPRAGMIGAYDRTPRGDPRVVVHERTIHTIRNPPVSKRLFGLTRGGQLRTIRHHIDTAITHGYRFGEHCLGGAYAVSDELLRRMAWHGFLADPTLWLGIDCPEDVMVGMYTRAVGLELVNFVDSGQVFGVSWRGLPYPPEDLLRRGYGVIHSLKSHGGVTEDDVRAFFRDRRAAG